MAEGSVLAAGQRLGGAPDQHHEQRDQRCGDQQHHAGERIPREHHRQHDQGHQRRQRKLRQVAPEVVVECVHPLGGGVGQLAAALLRGVGRAERGDVVEELRAQPGSHLCRGVPTCRALRPQHDGPPRADRCQHGERPAEVGQRRAFEEGPRNDRAQEVRLRHHQTAPRQPSGDGEQQCEPGAAGFCEQT